MGTRAIRGAITLEENTKDAIKQATIELLSEIIKQNSIKTEDISHVIFTLTKDLDADFPAKFARTEMGFDYVPMICAHEINPPGSLPMCFRILMVINSNLSQKEIRHVYLRGARKLRPDWDNLPV